MVQSTEPNPGTLERPVRLKVKLQIWLGDDIALGPGKAELLSWLDQTGSISAAARAMGLSYRRAWLMVDTMNRCFTAPLVETVHGGAKGGGARLSPFGRAVLEEYRNLDDDLGALAESRGAPLLSRIARGSPHE